MNITWISLGYDTTAQTLGYAAFEMVKNQDIQEKLRDEIDAAYEEADGMMPDYSIIQVKSSII